MPVETVRVTAVLPATPEAIYEAWLDSEEHALMTGGGKATVEPRVGGAHTAWDDYIGGIIVELDEARRIVQTWRTTEFPEGHDDSRLEVRLREVEGGTEVTLIHTGIPEGQGEQYEEGWRSHYFAPMADHFGRKAPEAAVKTAKVAPKKKAAPANKKAAPAKRKAAPAKKKATAKKKAAPKKRPAKKAAKAKKRGGKK